jgi:Flp pilus assembly protein TadG
MLRLLISVLSRLAADQRGAVLIKFTVALLPLLTVVGVALDVGQIFLVKQKLTNAVDAAGIAVGRYSELDEDEVKALAQSFVVAHYPAKAIGDLKGVTVKAENKQVDVTATASVPMTFLTILGYNSVDITASAMVLRQLKKIELVMVLDNSTSMEGSRLKALKDSANALVSTLFGAETTSNFVKIGLVPFSGAVNVGSGNLGAAWLDSGGLSALHKEDISIGVPVGKTLFDLFGGLINLGWGGCVRARLSGYDLTDEPPNPGIPETLFVPYFAPDGPTRDYVNDYLSDTLTPGGTAAEKQKYWPKYIGALIPIVLDDPVGPNFNCPPSPIVPLTNVKSTITTAINGMKANGSTVIPEGIAWGWRVLSPTAPFTEGAPYSDEDTLKFLILLSDGENNVLGGSNNHNKSWYSAYGFAAKGHLGSPDGSETQVVLNEKTRDLCANVKAKGIYVYTIGLQVPAGVRSLLESCATLPANCPGNQCFYDSPSVSSLEAAFTNIALGINKLRVAQ